MEWKSSTPSKKRRKNIRCIRKGWSDTNKEKEGLPMSVEDFDVYIYQDYFVINVIF